MDLIAVVNVPGGNSAGGLDFIEGGPQSEAEIAKFLGVAARHAMQELDRHRVRVGAMAAYPAMQGLREGLLGQGAALIPFDDGEAPGEELKHFAAKFNAETIVGQVGSAFGKQGAPIDLLAVATDHDACRGKTLENVEEPFALALAGIASGKPEEFTGSEFDVVAFMHTTPQVHDGLEHIEVGLGKLAAGVLDGEALLREERFALQVAGGVRLDGGKDGGANELVRDPSLQLTPEGKLIDLVRLTLSDRALEA